jgi:hypothetical protein
MFAGVDVGVCYYLIIGSRIGVTRVSWIVAYAGRLETGSRSAAGRRHRVRGNS